MSIPENMKEITDLASQLVNPILPQMEDLVTFEIAKKLKEKGYPQHIAEDAYIVENYGDDEYSVGERLPIPLVPYHMDDVVAPTVPQVLKWLREKGISIEPCATPYSYWYYMIKEKGTIKVTYTGEDYNTYEEAALAGIEYVLDNII